MIKNLNQKNWSLSFNEKFLIKNVSFKNNVFIKKIDFFNTKDTYYSHELKNLFEKNKLKPFPILQENKIAAYENSNNWKTLYESVSRHKYESTIIKIKKRIEIKEQYLQIALEFKSNESFFNIYNPLVQFENIKNIFNLKTSENLSKNQVETFSYKTGLKTQFNNETFYFFCSMENVVFDNNKLRFFPITQDKPKPIIKSWRINWGVPFRISFVIKKEKNRVID